MLVVIYAAEVLFFTDVFEDSFMTKVRGLQPVFLLSVLLRPDRQARRWKPAGRLENYCSAIEGSARQSGVNEESLAHSLPA